MFTDELQYLQYRPTRMGAQMREALKRKAFIGGGKKESEYWWC